jgi:hypothetical protein
MSPISNVSIVAGTPLAQVKGPDLVRAAYDVAEHQRQVDSSRKAANAAGIGAAQSERNETSDRDADGRRPWELPERPVSPTDAVGGVAEDPTGHSGTQLDLAG